MLYEMIGIPNSDFSSDSIVASGNRINDIHLYTCMQLWIIIKGESKECYYFWMHHTGLVTDNVTSNLKLHV